MSVDLLDPMLYNDDAGVGRSMKCLDGSFNPTLDVGTASIKRLPKTLRDGLHSDHLWMALFAAKG